MKNFVLKKFLHQNPYWPAKTSRVFSMTSLSSFAGRDEITPFKKKILRTRMQNLSYIII